MWSYGITLYEMWTKAAVPYGKKWTNMNVMLKVEEVRQLHHRFRLRPKKTSKKTYRACFFSPPQHATNRAPHTVGFAPASC